MIYMALLEFSYMMENICLGVLQFKDAKGYHYRFIKMFELNTMVIGMEPITLETNPLILDYLLNPRGIPKCKFIRSFK